MQTKKTAPIQMPEDLPPLSVAEQRLVEALGEGKNNTEAYQAGYGAEGYSRPALHVAACRKVSEPQIQAHLTVLRAAGFAKAALSRESRIEAMLARAEQARIEGAWSACSAFEQEANRLLCLHIERIEITDKRTPEDSLAAIAAVSPELAAELARQHGLATDDIPTSSTAH